MNLVFGERTFNCICQAGKDKAVALAAEFGDTVNSDWDKGYFEGHAVGYKRGHVDGVITGLAGVRPGPTQEEWDEAHFINFGVDVLDQMRADTIAGAPFVLTDEPVGIEAPYDISAECHDFQFDEEDACRCEELGRMCRRCSGKLFG